MTSGAIGSALLGWRLATARTLAWTLLLCGWIGLGSVVQVLGNGLFEGLAMMALWLLATGVCAELLTRLHIAAGASRVGLIAVGALTAVALVAVSRGGDHSLLPALLLAWAAMLALASVAVRACRAASARRPGLPVASGAAAAALTWTVVGDPADLHALCFRLAGAMLAACIGLVLLWPKHRTHTRKGCRAALFDCGLPAWPALGHGAPSSARPWPLMLAALVMLPMMCGLPLMLTLCRGAALGPQGVLGLHLAAMFLPALATLRWPLPARIASPLCGGLLMVGAAATLFVSGGAGWSVPVVAQGAAWSLAWAARLRRGLPHAHLDAPTDAPPHAPLAGAALSALLVLAFGFALEHVGSQALAGWHLALGLGAAWAMVPSPLGPSHHHAPS